MGVRRLVFMVVTSFAALTVGLLASSAPAFAAGSCPNEQLREETHSLSLPDCRAYELVSPPDTDGINVESENWTSGTMSGNEFLYPAYGAFGNAGGSGYFGGVLYLATRTATGWQTTATLQSPLVGPPQPLVGSGTAIGTSADGSQVILRTSQPLVPGAPKQENLYVRHADGSLTLLTPTAPSAKPAELAEPRYRGGSSDLSHVIFEQRGALLPSAPGGASTNNLYEWVEGQLSLVGILPNGEVASDGAVAGDSQGVIEEPSPQRAISTDGSRIFFTSLADGQLYVRENGISTVEASKSQRPTPDPNGTKPARYQTAATDGSVVFFTSSSELTADANTGVNSSGEPTDAGNNLYEFNVATGELIDLSVDTNPADAGGGADVESVAATSENGSYVYFVAKGELVAGEGVDGQPSDENLSNLYLYHAGSVKFITAFHENHEINTGHHPDAGGEVQATPDGRHLVFLTTGQVTSYRNIDAKTGRRDQEMYEYDAESGQIVCVSCNPSGAQPIGGTEERVTEHQAIVTGEFVPDSGFRFASENGGRVFFTSRDDLVPQASNVGYPEVVQPVSASTLKPFSTNVYEYEQVGEGSCAGDGGCIYLISSGTSSEESIFVGTSAAGDDVFFTTLDQLVGQDTGNSVDLYDARVDGGFPAPPVPASCSTETCQGPPLAPPVFATPSSVTFNGVGNFTPAPAKPAAPKKTVAKCAKGKKRSHGKCVKARAKKKSKAKKNAKAKRKAKKAGNDKRRVK